MPPTGLAARVLTGSPAPAAARRTSKTEVPTARELHLLNRFSAGYTPQTLQKLRKTGGYQAWFERQLEPKRVKESRTAKHLEGWFPALSWSTPVKVARDRSGEYRGWEQARDLANLTLLRRVYSERQLLEQMVDFWSNHLHVSALQDLTWIQRKSYDDMLRRFALTSYEKLLVNATLHPAMQVYLDNWTSVRGAPNENHGRELLELHTVGAGQYTEAMVKDSAKILSGYTVKTDTWRGKYDPDRHTTGRVRVLGFKHANKAADGRKVTVAYLRYLANHPATARRIALKLARRFVSEKPSPRLVSKLARVYLRSGTDIKEVLRALIRSPEFWASKDKLVRTPYDDLVATTRALRVSATRPQADSSFGNAFNWLHGAVMLYQWPKPDGAPSDAISSTGVSRMLSSFQFHWNLAGGWWPSVDVTYKKPAYWLPKGKKYKKGVRFDVLVDHLSRTWLGRRSTPAILEAACLAVDVRPSTIIDKEHAVIRWQLPRLAAVFLDSPKHLSR